MAALSRSARGIGPLRLAQLKAIAAASLEKGIKRAADFGVVLDRRPTIVFNAGFRHTAGRIVYHKAVIEISSVLHRPIGREDELRDTVLHELAHYIAGERHGHDDEWKLWAARLGATPVACHGMPTMRRGIVVLKCSLCEQKGWVSKIDAIDLIGQEHGYIGGLRGTCHGTWEQE